MIRNDQEFKAALDALPLAQQRQVAVRFVQRLLPAAADVRLRSALELALRPQVSALELAAASKAANSVRVESYTQCGRETDWSAQASHFLARATLACVDPTSERPGLAWEAAMSARMARICENVALGTGSENEEGQEQYRILTDFLQH